MKKLWTKYRKQMKNMFKKKVARKKDGRPYYIITLWAKDDEKVGYFMPLGDRGRR